MSGVGDTETLGAMLRRLRELVAGCRFGLATNGAEEATRTARGLVNQLDDYVQPRLDRLTGPLLMVVCGPTGAGKSTLVNSMVRARVSEAGALRPTTRAPVLVANPADASWFTRFYLLPTFSRAANAPTSGGRHLQVVAAPSLPPGLALLDAPDIDSVVAANRTLATELMGAADLWLFVTTANRYADEVPWQALHAARERGTQIAVVLDRVPGGADRVVHRHISQLLDGEGLADAPIFDVPESALDYDGLLPEEAVASLRDWFIRLAADVPLRGALAGQTLDGVLATLPERITLLAEESAEQRRVAERLRVTAREAHRTALSTVDDMVRRGGLLTGELLARWEEMVAGGELLRAVQSRSGRLRDQLGVTLAGRSVPGKQTVPAVGAALRALVRETLAQAAQRTAEDWERLPAGAALLSDVDDATAGSDEVVTEWLDAVLDLVRDDVGQQSVARQTTYTLHAVRLLVLVAVLIAPARAKDVGTERDMVDTVLADPVVRRLAEVARKDLRERIGNLVEGQRRRYDSALNRVAVDGTRADALRDMA
ncbi:MAG: GTPase domain-containing protein, partial [Actinocatenispora sp.]